MQLLCLQAIITVFFTEILSRESGLNAINYNWYDAQKMCRTVNSTITSSVHTDELQWTMFYLRESEWIGKCGCYPEKNVKESKKHTLQLPSAGLCQEHCLEHNQENNVSFFAIKNSACICLKSCPDKLPETRCSFSCLNDETSTNFSECGGETVYSVFLSRKMRESDEVHNAKNNICHRKSCLTRHVYTSRDKGQNVSNILLCERCSLPAGCRFVHCNESTNKIYCSNGKIFPARSSSPIQPPTIKATISKYPTISISTTNITRGKSRSITTEKVNKFSTTLKNSMDLVSFFANASLTITVTQSSVDNGNQDDLPVQVGILASTIGISIICIGLFAYCMRKSIYVNLAFLTRRKRNDLSLPTGSTLSVRNGARRGGLESRSQHARPSTQNYSFSYSLADNNKLNNQLVGGKDEQYHHLGQPDSEYNENDNYMRAEYNSNTENVHFVGGENHYNYLRENRRAGCEEDDTYSHATNVNPSNSSNYCVVDMKRSSLEIIGADLYDHFESRK